MNTHKDKFLNDLLIPRSLNQIAIEYTYFR